MSELYKILGRKTSKVEEVSPGMVVFEEMQKEYWPKPGELVVFNPNYEIGIEIEVERVNAGRDQLASYPAWTIKEDHSLRDGGWEYITVPIKGNRINYALNCFYSLLPKGYRFSPRTSIHIHQNALDMTPEQLATEVAAYALTEPLLYKFVGGERDKSNFAVPFKEADCYDLIELFLDKKFTFNYGEQRYLGLNIDSIRKFGSLEFRHLGGTDDKVKIMRWINLILSLKKYAMDTKWPMFKYKVDRLNTDSAYSVIVNEIYSECGKWLDQSNLLKDMEHGAACLKRLKLKNPLLEQIKADGTPLTYFWYQKVLEAPKKSSTKELFFEREPRLQPIRGARAAPPRQADLNRYLVGNLEEAVYHDEADRMREFRADNFIRPPRPRGEV